MRPIVALFAPLALILSVSTLSPAQHALTRYAGNPVMSGNVFSPDVMYDSLSKQFTMWYVSNGWTISYATSKDGKHWHKPAGNPILPINGVHTPRVIHDADGWKMYYSMFNHDPDIPGTGAIGLATSEDGTQWTMSDEPIITATPGEWDEDAVSHCAVSYDGKTYYMWYSGSSSGVSKVGLATSSDGIRWTKFENNPVFIPSDDGWDGANCGQSVVTYRNGKFHMFFLGANRLECCSWSIGYATSPDGINWTRAQSNPVLTSTGSGWESQSMGTAGLVIMNDTLHVWYSAESERTGKWAIGLATMPWQEGDNSIARDSSAISSKLPPKSMQQLLPKTGTDERWALQFQIQNNFTLNGFQGGTLSLKHQFSPSYAQRLGVYISTSVSGDRRDNSNYPADTTNNQRKTNQNSERIDLILNFIGYPVSAGDVHFYYGAGPKISFSRNYSSVEDNTYYPTLTFGQVSTSTTISWAGGAAMCAGVEWFATKTISLTSEYQVNVIYSHGTTTNENVSLPSGSSSSASDQTNTFNTSSAVLFGLSAYF